MVAVKSDTMGPPGQARWAGRVAKLRLTSHFRLELKSEMFKSGECVNVYAGPALHSVQLYSAAQRGSSRHLSSCNSISDMLPVWHKAEEFF